jgi:hypothetical protein
MDVSCQIRNKDLHEACIRAQKRVQQVLYPKKKRRKSALTKSTTKLSHSNDQDSQLQPRRGSNGAVPVLQKISSNNSSNKIPSAQAQRQCAVERGTTRANTFPSHVSSP